MWTLVLVKMNDESTKLIRSSLNDSILSQVRIQYGSRCELHFDDQILIDSQEIIKKLYELVPNASTKQKISNLASSSRKAYQHFIATGVLKAELKIIKERREICNSCPAQEIKYTKQVCTKCGCNIKAKTMGAAEACPLGKW